jgi:Ran GTPase-activating protein (RanGAP) involved in mRNA processing and transport
MEDLIESGALRRLKVLDLRHGYVTDNGARALAACRDSRRLELLDLTNNRLTARGVGALRRAGVKVRADRQQKPPYRRRDHALYCGDSE